MTQICTMGRNEARPLSENPTVNWISPIADPNDGSGMMLPRMETRWVHLSSRPLFVRAPP
jgi:hypothetical protein